MTADFGKFCKINLRFIGRICSAPRTQRLTLKSTTLKREEKRSNSLVSGAWVSGRALGSWADCHGALWVPHAVCPDRFLFLGQSRSVAPEPGNLRFKFRPRPLPLRSIPFMHETGVTKTPPSKPRAGLNETASVPGSAQHWAPVSPSHSPPGAQTADHSGALLGTWSLLELPEPPELEQNCQERLSTSVH